MREVVSKVYTFDELSDRAKERARQWFRDGSDSFNDWGADNVIEDAARLGCMIGIYIRTKPVKLMGGGTRMDPTVYWSGFSSQGDGASFEGSYSYTKGGVELLAAEAPSGTGKGHEGNNEVNRIACELRALQRKHFYRLQASISTRGNYSNSHYMSFDIERSDSADVPADDCAALEELLRDFADWIYHNLEREYEWQYADEQVDENIRANEYEFDEEGNRA